MNSRFHCSIKFTQARACIIGACISLAKAESGPGGNEQYSSFPGK